LLKVSYVKLILLLFRPSISKLTMLGVIFIKRVFLLIAQIILILLSLVR
jgi:hypothetical protein